MTLKPAQCALWLRPSTPPEQRNIFYRGFNRVYDAAEARYTGLIARMVARSGLMALIVAGARRPRRLDPQPRAHRASCRSRTRAISSIAVQLPEGASLERTTRALDDSHQARARRSPGVDKVVAIAGLAALNDSASLANAGIAYVILKDWSERGKKRGPARSLHRPLRAREDARRRHRAGDPAAADPGHRQRLRRHHEGGAARRQLRLRPARSTSRRRSPSAPRRSRCSRSCATRSAPTRPSSTSTIDRVKSETLGVPLGNALDALSSYVGSSYVGQFNKFGRVFQIYVQAEAAARLQPGVPQVPDGAQQRRRHGAARHAGRYHRPSAGPSLVIASTTSIPPQPSSPTPPAASAPARASTCSSRSPRTRCRRTAGFEWTAMSYQEKEVGNQIYLVYALSLLLVYLVLAGQYESWIAPVTVIVSVPLALLGTAGGADWRWASATTSTRRSA